MAANRSSVQIVVESSRLKSDNVVYIDAIDESQNDRI